MKEWLTQYCAMVAPQARVNNVPFWILSVTAAITRDSNLKAAIRLMKYFEGQPEYGDPEEANRLLGEPTITIEQWVATLPASVKPQTE